MSTTTTGCDYVLPLRWSDDAGLAELTGYLRRLSRHARVIVVDGSPAPLFAAHARAWDGIVCHIAPDPGVSCANGKVAGVITGMRRATADRVVIADDDVRYDRSQLYAVLELLRDADLVRPQNYFDPLPWHARWDTARTLLNRGVDRDYPGTFGIRRATWTAMGGYDGDVLFENLELIRTVRAHGGTERRPLDLYVRRLPPAEAGRFWSQRVRQAYDDLAQPLRMATFLAIGPATAYALARRRPGAVLAGAAATVALAEFGRRRAGGARVFPASASLVAPVWVAERAVCSWIALAARLRGGVSYAGGRLRVAAHSPRELAEAAVRESGPERSSRGTAPPCESRRRTAWSPNGHNGRARSSSGRDRSAGRPG
jgi:hypothetical protein